MPNLLIRWTEEVITAFARFAISRDLPDYCDLQTIYQLTTEDRTRNPELAAPYILVTKSGDYLTVYEVAGSFREPDEEAPSTDRDSWQGRVSRMTESLTANFRQMGHKISTVYECDPDGGADELKRLLAPQYLSIRRTGLNLSYLLDEEVEKKAPWVSRERTWLVCYSGRVVLAGNELRDENRRIKALLAQCQPAVFGQNPPLSALMGLKIRHDAFLSLVERALGDSGNGVMMRRMDAHEVGRVLRRQVDPAGTGNNWQPLLPDDPIVPWGVRQDNDDTAFLAPFLNFQVADTRVQKIAGNLLQIQGLWHGTLAISLGPQTSQSFAKLKALVPRGVPWRMRTDLMPGGMKRLGGKRFALNFASQVPGLEPIYESITRLAKVERHEPVCVMTITVSTWGKTTQDVTRNLTLLSSAFDSWGNCGVTQTFGDPVKAWMASLTASSASSGPCLLYPPLSEALNMLPLSRPASAWEDDGNALFPTPDGKIMPIGLATPKQPKLTTIIAGDSGGGKSVLLNILTAIMATSANLRLPWVSYIDKGFTGIGTINLLRTALPPERRDEVLSIILKNSPEYCRNLFDIQLGRQTPLPYESRFIVDMLTALCADPSTGRPPNEKETGDILDRLVQDAFTLAREKPRSYSEGEVPEVDAAVAEADIWALHPEYRENCKWYELSGLLQDAGKTPAAQRAHYQAMPELASMAALVQSDDFQTAFGTIERENGSEPLLKYIARCMTSACSQYRMFAGRTRFMISPSARVITVDLQYVAGDKTRKGNLQTGIMFLFAGHIAGGDFVLPQYQKELFSGLHPRWHPMHKARVRQLDEEVKTKTYDELHNVKEAPFIFSMLETDDREQRKHGTRTVLSSQYLRDFPEAIGQSANSVFMVAVDPADHKVLRDRFHVPEVTLRRFTRMGFGPSSDGSGVPFLGIFRTKGTGTIAHIMKNAVGPQQLWALSTTPEDMALRRRLYEEVGDDTARRILAGNFPGGSAARLIAYKQRTASETSSDNIIPALADELIAKQGYDL